MAVSRQSTHMAVPSGPRATMTATAERPEPQWPEDAVEFHSYFNLLNAIGSFHGSDDQLVNEFCRAEDTDDVTDTELLRRFYDGVAYLCDVKKGGETVTAAALANNVVLYLATNTKLPREVQNFIKWVVMIELRSGNTKSRRDVADSILQAAVERAAHRMEFYSREMKKFWAICSASFENQFRGTALFDWIASLAREPISHYQLAMKCYEARGSGRELEALKRAASDNEDMKELVHYIGRLGAHKFHVLNIMAATSRLAFVKDIVDVFFVPSSQRRTLELPDEAFDFEKLSKRISRRLEASENIRKELYLLLMGKRYDNELQMENDLHAKPIIDTLVHCELTLFDHVMRNKLRFYKNDRYIGCSKPACYFCLHWLEAEGLVRPKSHYKVLLECRGPDFSSNVKWIEARNYLKLCQQVAQDLYKALLGPVPESRTRYQSTDGSRRALTSLSETSSML